MPDLTVIVPSRGRPESINRLTEAFEQTCTADTELVVCVDNDDPRIDAYLEADGVHRIVTGPRQRLVGWTNKIATDPESASYAFGSIGDDHLPRTKGWDTQTLAALHQLGTGVAYPNDLFRGAELPTAAFLTADIVRTLGYMAPPTLTHLYCDNFWLDLGNSIGIRYLPDVIVEHLHPFAGKAAVDASYVETNRPESYAADDAAYRLYRRDSFAADVAKLRDLLNH
jgi:hypothetical protein